MKPILFLLCFLTNFLASVFSMLFLNFWGKSMIENNSSLYFLHKVSYLLFSRGDIVWIDAEILFYNLKNRHHFKRNCLGLYILIFIFYSRLAARLYNLLSMKSLVIIVGDSIFKSRGRILFILINNLILSFVFSS